MPQQEGKKMSTTAEKKFSHELDAAWIMLLWKAIHGGDPTPEQVAFGAIAALAGGLSDRATAPVEEASIKELQSRLESIGVRFSSEAEAAKGKDQYCVWDAKLNRWLCIYTGPLRFSPFQ
jgi:hypothetical protein